ncbi:GDSL-type esterase/lipase family protein [Kordiimonas pumila]|uniref:GDSL-type esterase/lipase family protein n=1 Tax=Kordiimonas pumila TaxID=2161677 RepID=A0ABV7DAK0_9PROT|nr:GDSL-type esterase/lipase family protein [Kordiimonas pumila]
MKICFFGDSFTNGTGDEACLGWAGRVCLAGRSAGKDITYYNMGVRGDTSADILARWQQEANRRLPKGEKCGLVFSFGTNDCAAGEDGRARLPQTDRLKNARAVLVAAPKVWPTLMVGPVPVINDETANKRIADLSRQMGALAKAHKVPYLEVFDAIRDNQPWQEECSKGDGTHPGSAGYALIADMVAAWPAWQDWMAA